MKFVCDSCERLVPLEQFRTEGDVLIARCSKCGAETRSSASSEAAAAPAERGGAPTPSPSAPGLAPARSNLALASAGPSNVVALRTPAIEAVEAAARSAANPFEVPEGLCPKCLSARPPEAKECPSCGLHFELGSPELELPGWLREGWVALLGHWDDEAKHEALRNEAVQKGELAPVGRLYRLRLAWQPLDPIATKGRDEVLRLALLPSTLPARKPAGDEAGTWKWVVLIGFFVVMAGALVLLALNLLKER